MWMSLGVTIAVVALAAGAMRFRSWYRRYRVLQTLGDAQLLRIERGVSMRILMGRAKALPGMNPNRANRTRGDLALTADRCLITSGRGTLADLRPGKGRRFAAVKCPGPGRLVIEGDVPGSDGIAGHYRIDMRIDDAQGWARALSAYVREDGSTVIYGEAPQPAS